MFDGFEAILALFFFVVMPLIQSWRDWQKKRQPPLPRPRSAPAPVEPEATDEDEWAPPPVRRTPHVVTRPVRPTRPVPVQEPVIAPRAARVHRRQSRAALSGLRGRADLRQAVVQMTILGPCRAQQPYNADA